MAIPDGAVLVVRKDGPAALAAQVDWLRLLDEVMDDMLCGGRSFDRAIAVWLVKRLLQRLGIRARHRQPAFALEVQATSAFDSPPRMSAVSKRLLVQELSHLPKYAAHRVHCASEWARMIRGIFPAEVCEIVLTSQSPYLACVRASDQAAAESLYARLHAAGVPVSTWPDLPPEVAAVADHAVAHRLRHTRLYLPVHQSVAAGQITACGNRLRDVTLSSWRLRQIDSKKEWEDLWLGCRRKSLPQTWEYGSAKAMAEGWQVQRFVVTDDNDLPTGLFQVLVKGLPILGGVARVNRGPLMLRDEYDDSNHLALHAIAVLVRESRRHRWWMMQIAPLLPPGDGAEEALRAMGFRRQPLCPMDSAVLSLEQSDDKLMMGLNGKWRNCLRKGQKLGVMVKLDGGGRESFQWLLDFYRTQQREKRFDGTSDRMLRALAANQSQSFKFNIFIAMDGSGASQASMLGVLVALQFGDVSEYLIGATNERGRANQANSVLLWEAILDAKRNGCRWFDVGGLAERTPKGIAKFKKGLNPEPYAVIGEWRRWF
jgi:lipid II:glycine glycyltransferase (peptidoglycan interpeptide bridge formation enzyme)